jgi:hypothetical protein
LDKNSQYEVGLVQISYLNNLPSLEHYDNYIAIQKNCLLPYEDVHVPNGYFKTFKNVQKMFNQILSEHDIQIKFNKLLQIFEFHSVSGEKPCFITPCVEIQCLLGISEGCHQVPCISDRHVQLQPVNRLICVFMDELLVEQTNIGDNKTKPLLRTFTNDSSAQYNDFVTKEFRQTVYVPIKSHIDEISQISVNVTTETGRPLIPSCNLLLEIRKKTENLQNRPNGVYVPL